ncbi:MAG TPA: hypothetical protein VHE55_10710 [Fimbriimonadaceae bacterium]|nr:hypothetical protein [Fimbriimonadaceae bacterium]
MLLFIFVGVPAGSMGGCLVVAGIGSDPGLLLIGIGGLAIGAVLLWLLIRAVKS